MVRSKQAIRHLMMLFVSILLLQLLCVSALAADKSCASASSTGADSRIASGLLPRTCARLGVGPLLDGDSDAALSAPLLPLSPADDALSGESADAADNAGLSGDAYLSAVPVADALVTDGILPLRTAPEETAPLAVILPTGSSYCVTGRTGDWYEIAAGEVQGYVPQSLLALEDSSDASEVLTVEQDGLALYAAPDLASAILDELSSGDVLLAAEAPADGWCRVVWNGCAGYLAESGVSRGYDVSLVSLQVLEDETALRAGAGDACTQLAALPAGTLLTAEAVCGGWVQVSYGTHTGYVALSDLTSTPQGGYPASLGEAVAAFAGQFDGNPYVWGGTSLTNGSDCSGFVLAVYAEFGVTLPHSSTAMRSCGTAVSYDEVQPGDIICYSGHVGIYAGDGQIINARNARFGICYINADYDTILAVRRIFN